MVQQGSQLGAGAAGTAGPGLGTVVALGAVAAGVVLARRRVEAAPPPAPVTATITDLELRPGVQSIAAYARYTGDGSALDGTLDWRPLGSTAWQRGPVMWHDVPALEFQGAALPRVSWNYDAVRGLMVSSTSGITPDRAYEVRVTFAGSPVGENPIIRQVRTLPDEPPEGPGPTLSVSPSGNDVSGDGSALKPYATVTRATQGVAPGSVIELRDGVYSDESILGSGTPAAWVTVRPFPGETAVFSGAGLLVDNVRNVHVKGMGFLDHDAQAVLLEGDAQDIQFSVCRFENWARLATGNAVRARRGPRGIALKDCVFEHTIPSPTPTVTGSGAIDLISTGGAHRIYRNKFLLTKGVGKVDAVSTEPEQSLTAGLTRDCEVFGNYVEGTSDDAFEAEGGVVNLRVWGNLTKNCFTFLGLEPAKKGPVWVFRNIVITDFNSFSAFWNKADEFKAFKAGDGAPGPVFIAHNTFFLVHPTLGHMGLEHVSKGVYSNFFFFNNIMMTSSRLMEAFSPARGCDADSNFYHSTRLTKLPFDTASTLAEWQAATGFDLNSIMVEDPTAVNPVAFADPDIGDLRLATGSLALAAGGDVRGISDGFVGAAPNMGAVSNGAVIGPPPPPPPPPEVTVMAVAVTPTPVSLTVGEAFQLAAIATLSDGSEAVVTSGVGTVWSSTDPTVLTVDQNGLVTANLAGRASVNARLDGLVGIATVDVFALAPPPPPPPPPPPAALPLALYTFEEGSGNVVGDTSGQGTPLDLTISDLAAVQWLPGGGLRINAPASIASLGPATKLIDASGLSNEVAYECWVIPANLVQSSAKIMTNSGSTRDSQRNVTLRQGGTAYGADVRVGGGVTTLGTGTVAAVALQHVVLTRDLFGLISIYVNGVLVASSNASAESLDRWIDSYRFLIGSDEGGGAPWLGDILKAAVYSRAPTAQEVSDRFLAGFGGTPPPRPPVAIFNAAPTTGDAPLVVSVENVSTGAFATSTWDWGDGTPVVVDQPSASHIYVTPGNYTIRLTVEGPNGIDSAILDVTARDPTLPPPPIQGGTVGVFERIELDIQDPVYTGNPFEVVFDGIFTHGSGTVLRLPGYYAGNGLFSLGFMPTLVGDWDLVIDSPTTPDLHGRTVTVTAVPSLHPGILKASVANPRKWAYSAGAYAIPIGFEVNMTRGTDVDFASAVDFLANAVQGHFFHHTLRNGVFTSDPSQHLFNLPVWDQLDRRLAMMSAQGVGVHFALYTDAPDTPIWAGSSATEALLVRYHVARTCGYPVVLYNVGTDSAEYRTRADIDFIGNLFATLDPYDHPRSSRFDGGGADAFLMAARTYESRGDTLARIADMRGHYQGNPHPVSMDDKWGENRPSRPEKNFSPDDIRRAFWKCVAAGGLSSNIRVGGGFTMTGMASELDSEQWLQFINPYVNTRLGATFGQMEPETTLVTGAEAIADPARTKIMALVIGVNDRWDPRIAGDVTVHLAGLTSNYEAFWFDTRAGVETFINIFAGGGDQVFTPPSSDDWVLLLEAVTP